MREYIYSLIDLAGVRSVLDLGCGRGYDLRRIGDMLGPAARLVGVDAMQKNVDSARAAVSDDPRFTFHLADVSEGLPFNDEEFDLVFSRDMLECIPDKDALIREAHRVLRPGGQVVFVHWDWDSQCIDGTDKGLVRRIIHAFGDWKQAWMADCDSWMGRRLWRVFNRSGLFEGTVHPYVLTNTEFATGLKGYETVKDFSALVRRGMISQEEYDRFYHDIEMLAAKGEYFYAVTTYIYVGRKL
jgi:ubiquinone/menaquinone biosynthesis C-methylase UbiE